ncbi:MAG: type IV pilus assembly protein PilM [Parcubacteria group bacterium]|nr:type IV pilus assembly protein PilM [Parcubacteria group bacterium]
MALLEPKFKTFGLDISDQSVKVAAIEKMNDGTLELVSFGEEVVHSGAIEHGEIKDPSFVARAIQSAMQSAIGKPLTSPYIIASLPEEKSFARVIQLPRMKKEELAAAVPWEIEANIPLPVDQVYYDWQTVSAEANSLDHVDILIGATPQGVVDQYLDTVRKAGLTPFAFEVESIPVSRALLVNGVAEKPVLICDLGFNRTSFIIVSGEAVRFTSSTTFSSGQMTQQIAKDLAISLVEAEKVKRTYGLDKKQLGGKILRSVSDILARIVGYAQTHIAYYRDHGTHEHGTPPEISEILLCGGGANLIGLDTFLSVELKLPVRRGNPWTNILKPPLKEIPLLPYERSLSYATAIGLALRAVEESHA